MTDKVKIGPKISRELNKRLAIYSINTGIHKETIIEMALSQFLQDKDMTPIVQLQLFDSIDITYDDPRFDGMKALLALSQTTSANKHGKGVLLKRLNKAYGEACGVGMCPELKIEYEEALDKLRNEQ